ncbi:MAG: acyltransferase family protein [Kordiimonadaceae bacterium]|jgi:glucans biosynthesis protein C|nr:acyltransferase family protein [Kordiimonadaceae bacterium]MBT6034866.1 acyltransferase family protein [Kordiimonadaceae bacterium]MBT7581891.1 acyltransferase family protein [Kordiimonadaceae bacterium]
MLNNQNTQKTERRYDLDWLRVLAFFILILFHSGMAFVDFPWHINNAETSQGMTMVWGFLHSWRMPLLFVISGAGIWYAFRKRNAFQFMKERSIRLLIPLIFGILVIVPPQIYLERLTQGVNFSSYIDFYPHFFEGYYFSEEGGNFSPHHLWFIGSLFIYCLAILPIILFMKSDLGLKLQGKIDQLMAHKNAIYLIFIPFYIAQVFIGGDMLLNAPSALLMILGFILVGSKTLWPSVEKNRYTSLMLGGILTALSYWMLLTPDYIFAPWQKELVTVPSILYILFAILGFGRHHLNFNNAFLKYSNEGVYAFYILHQTITVFLVYHLVSMEMNMWFKFALATVGTVTFTLAIYHFMIRPYNLVRPFFGLRQLKSKQSALQSKPLTSVDVNV